jgi:hypothetical protein
MRSFLRPGVVPDPVPAQPPYIPRILWQTCGDKSSIPPDLAACVARLKTMNATWQHHLFDDESQFAVLREVCSDRFLRAYARIEPRYGAARADLFRYVMVYLHGGAYLDLKSGTTRPLDEILRRDDRFIVSQWDNGPDGKFPDVGFRKSIDDVPGGEYEQWFIIAEPGHPFLAAALERALHNIETYNPFIHGYGAKSVLRVVGPDVYTRGIRSLEKELPHRRICSWREGLAYTMLPEFQTHAKLDKHYYGRVDLAPVTSVGLAGFALVRFKVTEGLHWPIRAFRRLNSKRLARHRARKAAKLG